MRFSVSVTTRAPRPKERDGHDYHFHSRAAFERMIAQGEVLEHAEVFGHLYGSLRAPAERALETGHDMVFDIDWQGGQQLRASALARDVVSIFILPPSIDALKSRLASRAQDSADEMAHRMAQCRAEMSHWAEYEYVLVNDVLDATFAQLVAIVRAARARRDRQPGLARFVRALDAQCTHPIQETS